MKIRSNLSTVLIANDEPRILELLRVLLKSAGYRVIEAENGLRALELALQSPPDLVVSDVVMPVMDGIEFCRRLKEDTRTAHLPVILLSGTRNDEPDAILGLEAGADDYIELPFRRQELLAKIARLIETHLLERHYRETVELAADIIFTRDMDGCITNINEAGSRFFGRRADLLIGTHLSDLIGNKSAEENISTTRAARSDEPLRWAVWLNDAAGKPHHLEGIASVVRDNEGCPVEVRSVVRDTTERKHAEEALRQSEERYRQMFERNRAIKLLIEPVSGEIVDANPAACEFYGYPIQEFRGKNIKEINMLDAEQVSSNLAGAAAQQPSAFVFPHRLASGEIRTVEVHSGPMNDHGRTLLFSIVHDVTERQKTEEALRESEERYRELFENANDIIYTHDLEGTFTSLNRTGERITGYTREEACKMNLGQVVVPEHLERAREMLARKAADDLPTLYELDILSKDGVRLSLEVSTRLIRKNGVPVGVQGIARDATDRKRVKAQLQESESELRALFAAMTDVILVLDGSGRYLKIAPTNPSLLYKASTELVGKTLHDVFPKWRADIFLGHIRRALADGKPFETEYSLEIKGKEIWFASTISPKEDNAVVWIARDISERKVAERALEEQFEREALINRITVAVRRSLDTSQVLRTAVEELGRHLNVDRCSLYVKDEKAGIARNVAEYHDPAVGAINRDFEIEPLRELIDRIDREGAVVADDVDADESTRAIYGGYLRESHVRSVMYVAIRVGTEMPAAFALSTTRGKRHWSDSDIALATAFADQTGIAIRQAELYQKAEATSAREALINRLSLAIRASLSMAAILNTATREVVRALGASRAHIFLYDPTKLRSPAEYEYVAPGSVSVRNFRADFTRPLGQELMQSLQPLVIDDSLRFNDGAPDFSMEIRSLAATLGTRSEIISPLNVNGSFRGALCIHQTDRTRHWTDDEVALVQAVGSQLATGIAQAELFEITKRAKKEWETTFNAMSDGLFIFDRYGQLIRVNRTGATMEGSWPHLLTGRKCCDLLRVSGDEECIVERTISDGRSVTVEITPERYNRPLLVTVEPVFENKKTVGAVCTARDLSELRKVEAVARERQSLLTNILESVREPICAIDTRGQFLWSNGATTSAVGFKPEELIGHHFTEIIYPPDREKARDNFERAIHGETQSFEARFHTREGEVRFALIDNAPLVTDGKTTGVLCIARDITEQKQQRQRAAQADKLRALGQLASGVAHDFNNALAAILGRAQLMSRDVRDERQSRNLEIIRTAAEDAASTVRRIQTFARQSQAEEFEMLELNQLLRDAVEITRTRWENEVRSRGLSVEVELKIAESCFTLCNASELREVFVNLIVNAVDAMPQGGKLTITGARTNDRVRLRFCDTGTGMGDDVRERIFEPFYTTKGLQGTGLGLAVSYGIIERHQGTISVETEVGSGTTFEVELPAIDTSWVTVPERKLENPTPSLSILVVDDEEFVRETLCEMLEVLNHRVVTADSGRNALEVLGDGTQYDMVFSDLSMPEMDGWEFAREVRRRSPEMNIVLVTGYGTGTLPPPGETNLINAIIGKPFDFTQITETIARVANGPILSAELNQ